MYPKLRFKGFDDAWEQRKFDDVFNYLAHNSLSRDDLNDNEGSIKNIHYGDVLIKFGNVIDTKHEYIPYVNDNVKLENKACFLQDGDVVIADAAEDSTVGKCTEISESSDQKIVSGLHTIPCRPKNKFAKGFLGYYLNSNAYHDQLLPLMQGTKVSSISKTSLKETTIKFPSSIEEQKKVGACFHELDNLITLHQRQCEALKKQKQFFLQNMFPKEGESEPRIRFNGFTEPWEQRELSELLKERNEQAPICDEYPLMAFIANQGVAHKGERYDRSALVSDEKNKKYKRTEYGDFIYSSNNLESGSIGLNKYGKASISPVYSIFMPTEITNLDFLGRRLVRKDFINSMIKWRQGVVYGQWKIHESDFLKIKIYVPSLNEQKKIGSYFNQLEDLISLHQRQYEQLVSLKKYLLSKMFI